jgi:hypothetical protein
MNRLLKSIATLALTLSSVAFGQYEMKDVYKLRNDKEPLISSFNNKDREKVLKLYQDQSVRAKIAETFYETVFKFVNADNNQCDLNLQSLLKAAFKQEGFASNEEELESIFKLLRVYNNIDDILYEILSANNKVAHEIEKLDLAKKAPRAGKHTELYERNDIQDLFSNFSEFPDEIETCSFQEFTFILKKVRNDEGRRPKKPEKDLRKLMKKALEDKVISLESFHKLEYLRKRSEVSERLIFFRDYFKIVVQAKNKMVPLSTSPQPPARIEEEDKFSSIKMRRFSKLTRRKLLYRKYDENQIVMLSQVLQKASRRMGVDVDTESGIPYVMQEFSVLEPNGERRTYVERIDLDPQSQFNFARRLLRKDMIEVQMMDLFNGLKVTYEDLVMAAFETGYVSFEDISYVVRYDDLWNPEISKFERVRGFVFRVAGYSSFFLPPPWNIVGTLAIGIVEGIVERKNSNGANNDNPATFIE